MTENVKKHDSGGLLWKRIKLTSTRKAYGKKRLRRVSQVSSFSSISRLFFLCFINLFGYIYVALFHLSSLNSWKPKNFAPFIFTFFGFNAK